MSRASQTGLWTLALSGSLVLHGAVGMALLAMPMPEANKPPPTEISFDAIDSATLNPQAPAVAVPVAIDQAAAVKPASVEAVAPVSASAPIAQAQAVKPAETQAVAPVAAEAAKPTEQATALDSVDDAPEAAAEAAPAPIAGQSQPAETMAPSVDAPSTVSPNAAEPVATAADQTQAAAIAASTSVAPADDAPMAAAVPMASTAATATEEMREAPLADGPVAAPVAGAATQVASVAPAATVASAAPVAPSVVQPMASSGVVTAVPDEAPAMSGLVTETQATSEPQAEPETQVAMLPPQASTGETDPATPKVKLADFLKSYEGGGCMLAIPTDTGALETLSDAPDSVRAMGREYRKQSGVPVKTERQTVSKAQCGTLAFSRSLAQYPNYPLKLELDARTIDSGTALSGRISGLRKPTLYLFVVDDEGKAKLIEELDGQDTTTVGFSVPLTLTDGTVDSVQLLVAVAADGPLKTGLTKAGVEAENFFSELTDEIRSGDKPIHYGITSFTVR